MSDQSDPRPPIGSGNPPDSEAELVAVGAESDGKGGRTGGEPVSATSAVSASGAARPERTGPKSAAGIGHFDGSGQREPSSAPTRGMPQPWVRPVPRWRRVPCPPGVIPAAAVAGVAAAVLVPLDRPGIGWVLAGAVAAGAIFEVDRRARGGVEGKPSSVGDAQEPLSTTDDKERPNAVDAREPLSTAHEEAQSSSGGEQKWSSAAREVERSSPGDEQKGSGAAREVERPSADDMKGRPTTGAECARLGAGEENDQPNASVEKQYRSANDRKERSSRSLANAERIFWAAVAFGLLAVGAFRAAEWLFALCVPAALVAASLAVVGRRTVWGAWHDVIAVPLAALVAVPWAWTGTDRTRGTERAVRIGWSVAVTAGLLAIFVPLLGSADATFGALVADTLPRVDTPAVLRWAVLFALAAAGALGALYLLAGPLPPADPARQPKRALRPLEWALPVGALTALFAVFVAMQFVALFGGDDYVLRTAGLTYAEYARSGFWQLAAVSVLTLAVIITVLRWAGGESTTDKLWLRLLTGALSLLSLVIVASAFARMWTYQQAYGFTVLRLLVGTCELWLGLIFVLVIATLVRLDATWLPRAALATAFTTLLALAFLNPERTVADRNIDRWLHGENLDTAYLETLSPDIIPALNRLPEPQRTPVLDTLRADTPDDTWTSWNLSRANAR